MTTIDPTIEKLAQQDAKSTGLLKNVILTQWMAEQGVSSTNQWFHNNPAGITKGNPNADVYATGVSSQGFLEFPTPQAGAKAYAALINTDPAYVGIRSKVKQINAELNTNQSNTLGNRLKSLFGQGTIGTNVAAQAELIAIAKSPWDAGHYTDPGKALGDKLIKDYNSITGAQIAQTAGEAAGYAATDAASGAASVANKVGAGVGESILSMFGKNATGYSVVIVITGIIIIGLLLYHLFTH